MERLTGELLDRVPPSDLEAERHVLGCCILQPALLDELPDVLNGAAFYAPAHTELWELLVARREARAPIDVKFLADAARNNSVLSEAGAGAFIAELAKVPTIRHAHHYAAVVRSKAAFRRVIQAGLDLVRRGYVADEEPEQLVADAETALREIVTGAQREAVTPIAAALCDALTRIDAIQNRREEAGLLTGLPLFDNQVGGLFPGELAVLAARPGVGKSALAGQIAHHAAERGRLVYFASLEMQASELATRLLCGLAGVNGKKIRTGRLGADDSARLTEHSQTLARAKLIFDDRPALRLSDIRRAANRLVHDGLQLVVLDYLQLVTPDDRRIPRYEQVGRLTAGLKCLARELNVPLLCLCQLNREAEQQDRPRLGNLRESGSIEQDADVVIFIHRKTAGSGRGETGSEAELIVAKNRNGETGVFPLRWHAARTMFTDAESFPPVGGWGEYTGG
jgi:replicative DNA helicase